VPWCRDTDTYAYFDDDVKDADIVKRPRLAYMPEHIVNANIGMETPWGLDVRLVCKALANNLPIIKTPLQNRQMVKKVLFLDHI
jgi:hypothetical protein